MIVIRYYGLLDYWGLLYFLDKDVVKFLFQFKIYIQGEFDYFVYLMRVESYFELNKLLLIIKYIYF